MKIWKCDKCGTELGERSVYQSYSSSKGRHVDLCSCCLMKYDEALRKADADFFKKGE